MYISPKTKLERKIIKKLETELRKNPELAADLILFLLLDTMLSASARILPKKSVAV